MPAYFAKKTMQVRRWWRNINEVLKKENQLRILYPEKISFKKEGEVKTS